MMPPFDTGSDDSLLNFLYQAPIALLQITRDGDIELITPLAASLLLPLSPEGRLDNLYSLLMSQAPQLAALVDSHQPSDGLVCEDLPLRLHARLPAPGEPAQVWCLSMFRRDAWRLTVVLRDMSVEVRLLEAQRQQSGRQLAALTVTLDQALEVMTVAVAREDLSTGSIQVNQRLRDWLGMPAGQDELLLDELIDFVHPDDQSAYLEDRQAALAGRAGGYRDFRYARADGRLAYMAGRRFLEHDDLGQPSHLVSFGIDVTEQRALERERLALSDKLELATRAAGMGVFELDTSGAQVHWSAQTYALHGVPHLQGETPHDIVASVLAPEQRRRLLDWQLDVVQGSAPTVMEVTVTWPDATRHVLSYRGRRRGVLDSSAPAFIGVVWDVTEERRIDAELRLAAAAFEVQDAMLITDIHGCIERVNQAFTRTIGYRPDEAVGRPWSMLRPDRQDDGLGRDISRRLIEHGLWQGEMWFRRKDGAVFPVWFTVTAVHDQHHTVTRCVCLLQDLSTQKAHEDEITRLALFDPLTGLPNRRLFKDRLQQAMSASARDLHEGVLLLLDLDRFKVINDTHGHNLGDQLLEQAAQRLTASMRGGDTVARLGGDEFGVLLAASAGGDTQELVVAMARRVGGKLLDQLRMPFELAGQRWNCTASIGVAVFKGHEQQVDELIKRAELAMYEAKAAGRDTLCFFDATLQQALVARSTLEGELRLALQLGQLVLHYQPLVDHDGRVIGAEALVRWQHPERGLVPPGVFIPIAEETGLIVELGRWVLRTACMQLAAWQGDAVLAPLTLAVNVSARELRLADFDAQVQAVLADTGANPARLKLELTESVLLDQIGNAVDKIARLRALGVRFALDDFGTGYASLTYLRQLPLDKLKIDQSFVRDMLGNSHDAAIARTIIDLGRNLGLRVVAEGVETPAQHAMLVELGCRLFQGYLFGRPAPVQALIDLARRQASA